VRKNGSLVFTFDGEWDRQTINQSINMKEMQKAIKKKSEKQKTLEMVATRADKVLFRLFYSQ